MSQRHSSRALHWQLQQSNIEICLSFKTLCSSKNKNVFLIKGRRRFICKYSGTPSNGKELKTKEQSTSKRAHWFLTKRFKVESLAANRASANYEISSKWRTKKVDCTSIHVPKKVIPSVSCGCWLFGCAQRCTMFIEHISNRFHHSFRGCLYYRSLRFKV